MIIDVVTYRRATFGFASCFVDVAPVKLHWNPFMYTKSWLVNLGYFLNLDRWQPTLLRARVRQVYPVPCANAFAIRARGHIRRDLEMRVQVPHAFLLHAEYDKVLWLHVVGV